jgi:hypothetical protein
MGDRCVDRLVLRSCDVTPQCQNVSRRCPAKHGRQLNDVLRIENFSMGLPMVPEGCRGRVVLLHVLASREQLPSAEWRSQGKTRSEKNEKLKKIGKLDTGDMVSYDSYHRGDGARYRTRESTWSVNLSRASVYCSSADFNVSFA